MLKNKNTYLEVHGTGIFQEKLTHKLPNRTTLLTAFAILGQGCYMEAKAYTGNTVCHTSICSVTGGIYSIGNNLASIGNTNGSAFTNWW